ncbi:MAG: transglutaminase-like cysteine peptidase [Alphaproteobacteria bacterium]
MIISTGSVVAAGNAAGRTAFEGKITSIKAVHLARAKPPQKLNDVIARHTAQVAARGAKLAGVSKPAVVVGDWQKLIARLKGLSRRDRVLEVERYFGAFRYVSDMKGWRKKDYWASPYEFIARRQGDCEDFAIARYMALREAGFDDKDLNLMGVTDRRSRLFHMVLAVNVDGEVLVLDNQAKHPVATLDLRRYEPAYAINQNNRWITRRAG